MSDRVAILKDGRLVQIDRPERLHDHPADSFVASFIGEASLLPVRRIDSGSVALGPAILRSARIIPNGDVLILAVHSEKLLIDDGAGDAARNRLTGHRHGCRLSRRSLRIFSYCRMATTLSPAPAEPSRSLSPHSHLAAASP